MCGFGSLDSGVDAYCCCVRYYHSAEIRLCCLVVLPYASGTYRPSHDAACTDGKMGLQLDFTSLAILFVLTGIAVSFFVRYRYLNSYCELNSIRFSCSYSRTTDVFYQQPFARLHLVNRIWSNCTPTFKGKIDLNHSTTISMNSCWQFACLDSLRSRYVSFPFGLGFTAHITRRSPRYSTS